MVLKNAQFSFQEANTLTSAQKCQNMACGNCYTQVSQKINRLHEKIQMYVSISWALKDIRMVQNSLCRSYSIVTSHQM